MPLKCLLVDDEPPALEILEKYVRSVDQLQWEGSCADAFKAMDLLQRKKIDLMFLDINMPKLSGTSFVKTLQHAPKVIFTTAYREYALDAFEVDAVDFLLKPVSFERFLKSVNKVIHSIPVAEEENLPASGPGFLYFRADRKMVKVYLDEILFVESLKDYVKIFRVTDKPLVVKQSISTLEAMLPRNLFLRVHRSFIVSVTKITAFTAHDVEIGKMEIPVGRLYSANLQKLSI